MENETKLQESYLLAAYQLSFMSRAAVVLYDVFGRGQVDIERFKKVYETSPIFKYDRGAYVCHSTVAPLFDISICIDIGEIIDTVFVKRFLLQNGHLKEDIADKIEKITERGVVATRDLARIAEYQVYPEDAVALLAFKLFGLNPVDIRQLEEEAVRRLVLRRLDAYLESKYITDEWLGKYYIRDRFVKNIVLMRRRVDDLLEEEKAQRRSLCERLLRCEREQLSREVKLAIVNYCYYAA